MPPATKKSLPTLCRLTADRAPLCAAVNLAAKLALQPTPQTKLTKRPEMFVLLDATTSPARVTATDRVCGVTLDVCNCETTVPGHVLLNPPKASLIIAELTDDQIIIESDGDTTLFAAGFSEFEAPAGPAPSEFASPVLPDSQPACVVPTATLAAALSNVSLATCRDEDSTIAKHFGATLGVNLDLQTAGILTVVATQGHEIAWSEVAASEVSPWLVHPTLPNPSVAKLISVLKSLADDTPVAIRTDNQSISFTWDGGVFWSRQQEGRFPNWRGAVPNRFVGQWTVPAASFSSALRQAALMTRGEMKRVSATYGPRGLMLRSIEPVGRASVMVPVPCASEHTVDYNAQPLLRALDNCPRDGDVTVKYGGGKGTSLLLDAGPTFRFVTTALVEKATSG
jgi:DNA polymerase-3 subunit beta